jgi:hypothetical protein
MKKYAGVGSRSTTPEILDEMYKIAIHLANNGWLLRSGGADGADLAFERGCDFVNGQKEIFLPWAGFNGSKSNLYTPSKQAIELAATIHPAWQYLKQGAKKLHARNVHQVLGSELDEPVDLIIAYTKDGKLIGGTATALRLGIKYGIQIINLATDKFDYEQIK